MSVFGAVNANRLHYEMAADALARADKDWLGRLITRRVPLDRWSEALERRPGDIKVVIDFRAIRREPRSGREPPCPTTQPGHASASKTTP